MVPRVVGVAVVGVVAGVLVVAGGITAGGTVDATGGRATGSAGLLLVADGIGVGVEVVVAPVVVPCGVGTAGGRPGGATAFDQLPHRRPATAVPGGPGPV
ncbi:hypothetical protein, partial [Pseudonocardia sp. SID8383]|uniref:hypothetical protein n=1 Tax=Pseudonocardia sp. SID8383 TaxID=2690363 RepID=UPI001380C8D1